MLQIMPRYDNKDPKEKNVQMGDSIKLRYLHFIWRIFNTHNSFFYCFILEENLSSDITKND